MIALVCLLLLSKQNRYKYNVRIYELNGDDKFSYITEKSYQLTDLSIEKLKEAIENNKVETKPFKMARPCDRRS